jgi:putative transposase
MKQGRFTEPQIIMILRQAEAGLAVSELCRERQMSSATFYKWRAKYGGMDVSMVSEMKGLEEENRRLKKIFAELSMQNEVLKEALGKNSPAIPAPGDGRDSGGATRDQHCFGLPDV